VLTHPSGSFRPSIAALVVALYISMQVVEGTGVHRCAAHDAGVDLQVGAGQPSSHHHAGSAHHGQEGNDSGHAAACPCLGDCQNSPATAASAVHTGPSPVLVVAGSSSLEFLESFRTTPQYLLPFANGPPLIA